MSAVPTPEKRRELHFYTAMVALGLAYCFYLGGECAAHWFKQNYHQELPKWLGWVLELSSPIAIFGILSVLFEEMLWKLPLFQSIPGICPPAIEGAWKAEFKSSYDNYQNSYFADVDIRQSWSTLTITLVAEKSRSASEVAAIHREENGTCWLIYEYLNEPVLEAKETMHKHRGTARLEIKNSLIEGDYYNAGRDRNTFGTLKFTRPIT